MSYKWVHYTEQDSISQIEYLRKTYNTPNKQYYFVDGYHKDKPCIFVCNDISTRIYGDPIPSKQFKQDIFFPPLDPLIVEDYEVNKSKREWKIRVDTVAGITLWIIPATMEPKKLVFDFDDTGVEVDNSPYSTATDYGTLAYSLFADIEKKIEVNLNDARVKKLVMLGLKKSYMFPIDVINWAGLVSTQDLDPLLSACMGIDEELQQKKSNGSGE